MPAHLRPLARQNCDEPGCPRSATAQLLNTYNAVLGKFCAAHGTARLKKQLAADNRYVIPGRETPT